MATPHAPSAAFKKAGARVRAIAKSIQKSHPRMEWKNAMAQAGVAYRKEHPAAARAKASASKARSTAKRVVGYDPSQVRLKPIKKGPHTGGRTARRIGRGLFALPRNPGQWLDRAKESVSLETAGTALGVVGGAAAAIFLPRLLGGWNEGKKAIAFSVLATIAAGGAAAVAVPSLVVPVAAGGVLITVAAGAIYIWPRALAWITNPFIAMAGSRPAGSGAQGAYANRGAQGAYANRGMQGAYQAPKRMLAGPGDRMRAAPLKESGYSIAPN